MFLLTNKATIDSNVYYMVLKLTPHKLSFESMLEEEVKLLYYNSVDNLEFTNMWLDELDDICFDSPEPGNSVNLPVMSKHTSKLVDTSLDIDINNIHSILLYTVSFGGKVLLNNKYVNMSSVNVDTRNSTLIVNDKMYTTSDKLVVKYKDIPPDYLKYKDVWGFSYTINKDKGEVVFNLSKVYYETFFTGFFKFISPMLGVTFKNLKQKSVDKIQGYLFAFYYNQHIIRESVSTKLDDKYKDLFNDVVINTTSFAEVIDYLRKNKISADFITGVDIYRKYGDRTNFLLPTPSTEQSFVTLNRESLLIDIYSSYICGECVN